MEKKILLAIGGIILVMIVIVIGAVLLDSTPLPSGEVKTNESESTETTQASSGTPTGFALSAPNLPSQYIPLTIKIVTERSENIFFEKNIIRVPAKGVIILPIIDNNGTITAGVSVDSDKLDFGRIQSNLSGITKSLDIAYPFRTGSVKICVIAQGDIKQFLETPNREFIMSSGEKKEVQIRFSGSMIGNFTGEVDVLAKKPKYGFLDLLLPWVGC
jgi:hypothetical protein